MIKSKLRTKDLNSYTQAYIIDSDTKLKILEEFPLS